jgi:hypothetical protein
MSLQLLLIVLLACIIKFPEWCYILQLDIDFRLHFPNAVNLFCSEFPRLVPGIMSAARLSRRADVVELLREYDSEQHGEPGERNFMYALLTLLQLLPSTNTKYKAKLSSVELEHALITFKPQQTSITLFLSEKKSSQTQPQLLCIGSKEASGQFYLILDKKAVLLRECGVLKAIDLLFQAYYVYWVGYRKPIALFMEYL